MISSSLTKNTQLSADGGWPPAGGPSVIHDTVACPSPPTAVPIVGAPGTVAATGVTALEAADSTPVLPRHRRRSWHRRWRLQVEVAEPVVVDEIGPAVTDDLVGHLRATHADISSLRCVHPAGSLADLRRSACWSRLAASSAACCG